MAAYTNGYHAGKKHILLNAFDMSTVGHLSPGQWKVSPVDYLCAVSNSRVVHRTPMIARPTNASWTIG